MANRSDLPLPSTAHSPREAPVLPADLKAWRTALQRQRISFDRWERRLSARGLVDPRPLGRQ
ncbi:hypothetical protein OPKNFCMD_0605 [Methylobacterium crusticola]|uniref:XRE family transcriptional regulator n=1 Tax=Methylobacterium crusticola TaxID=1697972 RepID=A0ABQ4QRH5_9HYPH|nr:hypothetical protein OPKNFCMD_0605 [Methylobacterium crusticola]